MKWKLPKREDKELKQIAKDIYNNRIFTDRHLSKHDNIMSTFMVLVFMGPKEPEPPKYPSDKITKSGNRDNRIFDILDRDKAQKEYEEKLKEFPKEQEEYKKYLDNIGLIYEYYDKSGTLSINGNPTFFSANFLDKEDTEKMFEYYETYKSIREKSDNF